MEENNEEPLPPISNISNEIHQEQFREEKNEVEVVSALSSIPQVAGSFKQGEDLNHDLEMTLSEHSEDPESLKIPRIAPQMQSSENDRMSVHLDKLTSSQNNDILQESIVTSKYEESESKEEEGKDGKNDRSHQSEGGFSVRTIYSRAAKWGFDDKVFNLEMMKCQRRSEEKVNGSSLESKGIVQGDGAQLGYGEITAGSIDRMIDKLQNFDPEHLREHDIENVDSFKLSNQSRFLDIGSGGGKAVMHVALKVGCQSHGIEVLENRIECSNALKGLLLTKEKAPAEWGQRVTF